MASILCGTRACIWTGNREISWRHCRKTPKRGSAWLFFILAMGQAGVPLPKPKDREELCFSFGKGWGGQGRTREPGISLRHCFPDANPDKRKRPFLLRLSALDQPERSGKGGAEEGNGES